MDPNKLKLEILTPQRKILTTETAWVTLPALEGEMGVLPEHLPVLTTLDTGIFQYESGGKPVRLAMHYGYATVQSNTVTVLSEMVEKAGEIDIDRAKRAEQRAREELKKLLEKQTTEEYRMKKFEAKLQRSVVRQSTGG